MDRAGHNHGEITVSHEPVLLAESVQHLMLKEAGVYVDGTTGQGGHSEAMLLAEPQVKAVLGIDWDTRSLEFAQSRLADFADRFLPAAGSYTQMVELAAGQGISSVDGVLLDLGFSSLQIEGPEYGLSFQEDGPLDMRYNPEGGLTAEEIINTYSEHELGQIIRRYGEEPRGMAIARAIIKERPVQGTAQLASIVGSVLGRRPGQRVSPATKTFQALRVAVNDELSNVERGIDAAITLLAPGGRLAVISYHSLEDRIIKTQFNREAATCVCPPGLPVCTCGQTPRLKIINRRVIKPSQAEIDSNPRSRSAKLRVAERV
ncbi:MAG TPA: 16S rRNA (cytosine(1402)-N(4))-methyltransferase [Dehalococcoidia bacterium]|nr:16S rRNA (cytosine(1402)-N(4))-methyltransferase [Chloroflexota bacterium]HCL26231.1 16S rRNA (cytosine(1402)-N(4))-methyltransferase [Dehalococcoidia bacterium]